VTATPVTGIDRAKKKTFEWIRAALWAVGIWLVLSTFLVQAYFIPSPSMEKTLMVGDVLFVNKFLYGAKIPFIKAHLPALRQPRRGDIVVFISPIEDSILVKRLIGLPGDTLQMKNGAMFRNGKALDEPYTQSSEPPGYSLDEIDPSRSTRNEMRTLQIAHYIGPDAAHYLPDVHEWGPIVVPKDSLWMMGDNRDMSRDARFWGFVPRGNVRGTPIIIYYSWDHDSYRPLPFFTATRWGRIFHIPK
jgi:signal peptidase I